MSKCQVTFCLGLSVRQESLVDVLFYLVQRGDCFPQVSLSSQLTYRSKPAFLSAYVVGIREERRFVPLKFSENPVNHGPHRIEKSVHFSACSKSEYHLRPDQMDIRPHVFFLIATNGFSH